MSNPRQPIKEQQSVPVEEALPPLNERAKKASNKSHVYLIDGSGFIFRAYHALPPLTRSDGTPVGAVLGFCNIILKLLETNQIDYMAVVFDTARRNFRHDFYPEYKANRAEPPEDLVPQFSLIREACKAFHLPSIELDGYEADDIIATYARQATAHNSDVTIVSSDKDLMQLINDDVKMLDPLKGTLISYEEVEKKFGVHPNQVIDVQALAGDAIDNIPGVPGIGVKTAAQLIQEFGSLENLLDQAGTIKQPKRRAALVDNTEAARLSKRLVRLDDQVPLTLSLDALKLHNPAEAELLSFLQQQGFKTLVNRLLKKGMLSQDVLPATAPEHQEVQLEITLRDVPKQYTLVQDLATLENWCRRARREGLVAFDTETTSLNLEEAILVGFSLALNPGEACYVPLAHLTEAPQVDFEAALAVLKGVLEDPSVCVVGQNIKYDMRVLLKYGIEIAAYEDTMVMSYDVDGVMHGHGLDELAELYFQHPMLKYEAAIHTTGIKGATFDHVNLQTACDYAAEDADYTLRLYHVLKHKMTQQGAHTIYYTVDRPMVRVLALMEHKGVKVDTIALASISENLGQRLESLEQEIHALAGRAFVIGSPKQLGEVLFQEMGLAGSKKGKSGSYSTGADVLEEMANEGHLLPEKVLEWRQYAKLKSTYSDALAQQIDPGTQRVHTSYGLTVTSTGRLSSSDPNLQNIPIRTEEGRQIRKAFIAEPGYKLVSLDYSQIELRLLAHMAEIPSLIQAFKAGQDIHAKTASEIFGVPMEGMDPMLRRSAKAINFGIIYGISSYGLARQLKISREEAAQHIDAYFKCYPGIRAFMEAKKEEARRLGYVTTIYGRRCYMKGINDPNYTRRSHAERQAINAPLQGSQADIIKRAMYQIGDILQEYNEMDKASLTEQREAGVNAAREDCEGREGNTLLEEAMASRKTAAQTLLKPHAAQLDLFGGQGLPAGVTRGMPNPKPVINHEKIRAASQQTFFKAASPANAFIGSQARLILQVHDELIFEVKEKLVDTIIPRIKELMQSVIHLRVPLVVDAGVGDNWDEAH
jgi:DNA polymerase I